MHQIVTALATGAGEFEGDEGEHRVQFGEAAVPG